MFRPHLFNFKQKKFLASCPSKTEGRDYAFYMRDYKGQTVKPLAFYVTDFLFTGLESHNIWEKIKNHMKNDLPKISSHLHISDSNWL